MKSRKVIGIVVAVVVVILAIVLLCMKSSESASIGAGSAGRTASSTAAAQTPQTFVPGSASAKHAMAADVYPLYSGVQWGAEQAGNYQNLGGYGVTSQTIFGVMDLSLVFQPFETYYAKKLAAAGWTVDIAQAAAGPGSEVTAYQKGDNEIIVSYNSIFTGGVDSSTGANAVNTSNEPEQCPCNVTMFLFSGK